MPDVSIPGWSSRNEVSGVTFPNVTFYAKAVQSAAEAKTFAGWEGDTQVWRIEEGALVSGRPDVRQPGAI